MPAEQLESQVFILLSLLLGQRFESFELDKGLRTIFPTAIEETSDDDDAVDLLG